MRITFSHTTALAVLRALRAQGALPTNPTLRPFSPLWRGATGRLTIRDVTGMLDVIGLEGARWLSGHRAIDLLYERGGSRPRTKGVLPHAYGLPRWQGHFVDIPHPGSCLVASPALVLVELAAQLPLAALVELANEFQSTFSRDPLDPCSPHAFLGARPLVTRDALLAELAGMDGPAAPRVLRAVALSSANAWSPRESIIATMASLPLTEGGYGLGPLTLNGRLVGKNTSRASRIPDIMFGPGADVGINYDGWDHLDLVSFERAALALGAHPGSARAQAALDAIRRQIRAKYVDDRHRDRDLLAMGVGTLVATSEDLARIEGLDLLMRQVVDRLMQGRGQAAHGALDETLRALDDPARREQRRQNLQALLHGL